MALTQTRRITHYSSNDGRMSEYPKMEEQRPQARKVKKAKGIAVKTVKKVRLKRKKEGDGNVLWKKKNFIGTKWQLQDFKGSLQYDEKGVR